MKFSLPLLAFISLAAVGQCALPTLKATRVPVAPAAAVSKPKEKSEAYAITTDNKERDEGATNAHSFYMAVSMIVVSEIGDKTFLIAALMSMRYPKLVVFSAAFSSLAVMTVLLGLVGHALPGLVSERITHFLAAILFVVFGINLLREGLSMSKDAGVGDEMAEVEEELQASTLNSHLDDMETGGAKSSTFNSSVAAFGSRVKEIALIVLSPVWIQVFVMTFLGEWGDRSQIATIAMAAGSDYWTVIMGAVVGHALCTAAATIGGQLLATRISMRNVTLGGAAAFFIFSILYFYDFYASDGPETQS
ncbi:hypothetical protein PUMCH_004412 [Australozyma saopauloensis]|uniref:GDT1 family protein n=1 Tax=Australozyma saopauloensis TaxID=291208 RepID=A0AAX4HET4_9ASCO|nr:hypothetical protein PUMCH_004412 [[Candida] saopauloensis]